MNRSTLLHFSFYKVKATSLVYALLISLVLSVLIASLFAIHSYRSKQTIELLLKTKLLDNCYSGIILSTGTRTTREKEKIDLFGFESDSILLTTYKYGLFNVNKVTSFWARDSIKKIAFSGPVISDTISGLSLSKSQSILQLVGNTRLYGITRVPEARVEKSNFRNKVYRGLPINQMEINEAVKNFPEFEISNISHLEEFFELPYYENLDNKQEVINSFSSPTIYFYVHNSEELINKIISGNIYLISHENIVIPNSCMLENVVVIAKNIVIERGFEGKAQFISFNNIEVGDNCNLNYPSILANFHNDEGKILVENNTIIDGAIIHYSPSNYPIKGSIFLSPSTRINGSIYSNSSISLKGEVNGKVISKFLIYNDKGNSRINLIEDAIVNPLKSKRNLDFVSRNSNYNFLQWLN